MSKNLIRITEKNIQISMIIRMPVTTKKKKKKKIKMKIQSFF